MSILPFVVGGAAIGGVIVLARMGGTKSTNASNAHHGKSGDAGPTPGAAGSVDVSQFSANASDDPVGVVGAGGMPATGDDGAGNTTITGTSDDGQTPYNAVEGSGNTISFGSTSQPEPTGGAQPGQIIPIRNHDSGQGGGVTVTAGTTSTVNPGAGLVHTVAGPNLKGLTKRDITNIYAANAGRTGTYI